MLLKATTRQMFVDLHFEAKLVGRLKNDNRDDEFLISRIIFLTTYDANVDMEAMIDQHHLADTICLNLSRHAKVFEDRMKKETDKRSKEKDGKKEKAKKDKHKSNTEPDPMEDMALTEILKLLFNITHFCPHRANAFTPAIPSILTLLSHRPANPMKPMDSPIAQLIHGLINLELEGNEEYLYPKSDPKRYPERMIELLDLATLAYEEKEMEAQLSPLLTLMRKVYSLAPRPVKNQMRHLLLPTEEDRVQPLGKTDTLSSRILRLSTSPVAPTAREELSSLLFEMSDKDAKNFVQNVGYGFASGFLFQHNVPIPESATEAWSTSDVGSNRGSISRGSIGSFDRSIYSQEARSSTSSVRKLVERTLSSGRDSGISAGGASTALPIMGEKSENAVRGPEMAEKRKEAGRGVAAPQLAQRERGGEREPQRKVKRLVNPITGQYLDRETFDDDKPMTEDEKIREAEKLMVLFERYGFPYSFPSLYIALVYNPKLSARDHGRF
jgi:hypothetical protein